MIARISVIIAAMLLAAPATLAQVAVRAKTLHTMSGPEITDGVVVITDGKIAAVGPAAGVKIPEGYRVLDAAVATPGLIDAHSTVGVSGLLNQRQDQDQLERSAAMQPELRAVDAYNPGDPLVEWVRSFGVTAVHTGHAPGELISGQTMVVKTAGRTVEEALVKETGAIAATLSPWAQKSGDKAPGTRAKMVAMLRGELIKAREYAERRSRPAAVQPDDPEEDEATKEKRRREDGRARNLRLEALGRVLSKETPLLVTANRAQDIQNALRLAKEFDIRIILDSAAEAYLLAAEIRASGVPVIIHPEMTRAFGDLENMSFETPAKLRRAGVTVAMQSGYEAYVPKTRVVLFEAGRAVANGMAYGDALAMVTTNAAKVLGVDARIGSLEVGKDGDVALYDGDPFEYTTHCIGVVIDGKVVSETVR